MTEDERRDEEEAMAMLAANIDQIFNGNDNPKTVGFMLIVFPFDVTNPNVNYVSNADRKGLLEAMKNIVARWEAGRPDQGRLQ